MIHRYKDDAYDRFWSPHSSELWTQVSISDSTAASQAQNEYKPPPIVLKTAATPINESASLDLYWHTNNVNDQYYIFMHFSEVVVLAENETREFNVSMNGEHWYGPLTPVYLKTDII